MPKQPRTSANKGKVKQAQDVQEAEYKIPYVSGFKAPSARDSRNAIGFTSEIPVDFDPSTNVGVGFEFFPHLPEPTHIDDWLAQYCEEGQTFKQFVKECPWLSSRKRKYMSQEFQPSGQTIKDRYPDGKVYIVPIGDFGERDSELFSSLIEYTSIFLGLPVKSLPKIDLHVGEGKVLWIEEPNNKTGTNRRSSQRTKHHQLTSRFNAETKHIQVCVDSNLMQLRNLIPEDAICMIGLTMLDLYGDDSDLFVAGMAAGNQRVAIFSLYRYDPCLSFSTEHWFQIQEDHDIPQKERQRVTLQRGCKLLVHEICHLLGIDHCIYYDCCMNGSGHLSEDFRQPMHLCPVDLRKLYTLVGFNVVGRYRLLHQYYKNHGFKEEEKWVQKRLKFICS
ncbi:archaemetzincin-2-like [Mercenaria mercenaria]|uniref:archaemetzincin-2-like n=1 Tax=Mercenaria mercenaria TaxID=6596 RepID=UPI00234E670F|nr:archaemetzincin-2-like [Mercenaria mercenaria]